jgi:hypothetical protein
VTLTAQVLNTAALVVLAVVLGIWLGRLRVLELLVKVGMAALGIQIATLAAVAVDMAALV